MIIGWFYYRNYIQFKFAIEIVAINKICAENCKKQKLKKSRTKKINHKDKIENKVSCEWNTQYYVSNVL